MGSPSDRRYSAQHIWAKMDGDIATFGLTKYNVSVLGQVTSVTNLSAKGTAIGRGDKIGTINRSGSSSGDGFIAPLGGQVTDREEHLLDIIEVNADPYAGGSWFITIKGAKKSEYDELMSADQYDGFTT